MRGALLWATLTLTSVAGAQTIYVSPRGKDTWAGTEKKPVATFARAQEIARSFAPDADVTVLFDDGIYYLPHTIEFTSEDSKTLPATVTYRARNRGKAVISGGMEVKPQWRHESDGIMSAGITVDGPVDQLYIDGKRQRMARYPDAQPGEGNNVFDTWRLDHAPKADEAADALAPARVAGWSNLEGGYVHAMHSALWGDMHWLIKGRKADGTLDLEGGWQNNRPSAMHPVFRMVENIREELDTPGEWYYDGDEKRLYYMPEPGADIAAAKVELVRLPHLVEIEGSIERPVTGVCFDGLVFRHTGRTFMENKEPLLRSDWTVYRGGAVTMTGASDCRIANCEFDQNGGNSIFINNFNRRITVSGCYIHDSGANGIAFVGNPSAVRSPLFRYGPQDYDAIDTKAGPLSNDFPQECSVTDCLITRTGRDEKQTAPVQISMSYRITVDHCSIYDVPRAGINISEGTFGGHVISHCDVFDTVLETGDHGSFNSWGRDRYWTPDVNKVSAIVAGHPAMTSLDMIEPNVIRDSRWRCDHGWDIDLDDGSSHYRIYNNLLLNGGLKLREGYDRIVTNNVVVANSLHPHVWYDNSGDVFSHNIVSGPYLPAIMQTAIAADGKWGREIDYNLFASGDDDRTLFAVNGCDIHSVAGDPRYVDSSSGDFRVSAESPAWSIGFRNFSMDDFGVTSPGLRAIARKPAMPERLLASSGNSSGRRSAAWIGARLKEVRGNELSAFGVGFDKAGIAVEHVEPDSRAEAVGLRAGDLIQTVDKRRTVDLSALRRYIDDKALPTESIIVIRNQQPLHIAIDRP